MNNVILDIGANNGIDGLGYALFNQNFKVFAFEPNPELIKIILNNKKKIENFFRINLKNYSIIQKAVSDYNGKSCFYLSEHNPCSSLLKFKFVNIKKKISCDVTTLKKFCEENKIDNIAYLHCDAQGSDLNVLRGLGKYKKIIHLGVIETMKNKSDMLYEGEFFLNDFQIFFRENNFKVLKKIPNNNKYNVLNVYFKNTKILEKNFLKIKEFNRRFVQRIFDNRIRFKDILYKKFLKYKFIK